MCLTEFMGGKCQDNWRTHDWRLQRDIAPVHTALSVESSLTESNMAVDNTLLPRPNPLWLLRVSKDDNPMQGTKIQGCPTDWSWNTGGNGKTGLPRDVCNSGATVGFVKISAVKARFCTGWSINLCSYIYCCTVHFDYIKITYTNKCTLYLTYKMLKFTIKTSIHSPYMFRSIWTIFRDLMVILAKVTLLQNCQ
jgi:hypothetical protein